MIMNTVHYTSGILYSPTDRALFKDFDEIPLWAQPGVLAAAGLELMLGVGDIFDYEGHISREQAIATLLRMYKRVSYEMLTIKGVAALDSDWINTHFTVGKDYIYMDYPDTEFWKNNYDEFYSTMTEAWDIYKITNDYPNRTLAQATSVYAFYPIMSTGLYAAADASKANKSITIDFGYMTYTTLTPDHVIEMRLKPITGFMTTKAGYTYGYPEKVPVEPKVIE